ncbi:MAG: cadherin domain-containing protein [Marinoscillum sp.]
MTQSLALTLVPYQNEMIRMLLAFSLLLMGLFATAQNAAPTDITLNSNSIFENSTFGAQIGAFSSEDEDELDNHSYSLVAGGGDVDNAQFYITAGGILRSAATFNYEVKDAYSIRVLTDDGHGGVLEKSFDIVVEDAAESPTNITLNPNSIAENNQVSDVIGTLTPVDEDEGETYTFGFSQSENYPSNSSFEIVNDEVRALESFDFETKDFYVISVEVQDSRGGHYQRSHSIAINNVVVENHSPTNIDLSPRTIDEENTIGDVIGTLSTTDEDAGDSHSYSLIGGAVDNDQFTLTGDQLKAGAVFDYETKSSYVVQVKSDDGNGGLYVKNLTVLIANIAESGPPTSTVLSSLSIDENNDLYDVIGTFSTTDPDAGDTFAYALIAGGGDSGNNSFRIVGNELQANTIFDYESNTSYSILVQTTDGQANTIAGNYTISINDLDDVVTLDFKLNSNSINENVSNGTLVGTLTPINATVPHQVNFQLVAGDGDTGNALFNRSGRDIHLSSVPDYETKKTYSIRVEADDQGNLVEKILLIHVNDLNEAPTFVNVSATTIQENNAIGQVVAVLSTDDPDEGDTFTYSFASAEPQFTIDGNLILANETFNFERVPPIAYNVTIRSRDAGFQFSPDRNVSFTITNQNESPTDVSLSWTSIFENKAAGSIVGTASTTDEDNDDTHTYTVVPGFADADKFEFSDNELQSTELFNYEERSSYTIRVQTEDAAGAQHVEDFTITISNATESPFDIELSNLSIDENNQVGDVIGTLSASDPDVNDTFTYSVLGSPADGLSFDIANGNELVADEAFDFEDQGSYTINIRVRDQTNRSYTEEFTITVNDLHENQAPTAIALNNSSIDENNTIGDAIGNFTTTDADSGDSFSYSFVSGAGGEDNGSFSIIEGNELVASVVFDYEVKSSFDIKVRSNDGNGGTFDETFTIVIEDVNENSAPTDILLSNNSFEENRPIDYLIGSFSTIDPDDDGNYIYTFVEGEGDDDNDNFSIYGINNNIHVGTTFDFETKPTHSVRIQTDDRNGGLFEKVFTILIEDANENPTAIALTNSDLDENNDIGDAIGTLSSEDQDSDDTHSYSIRVIDGSDDHTAFAIEEDELKAAIAFDFETQSSYTIRIQSRDEGGLTYSEDFVITINDGFDNSAPTNMALSSTAISENNEINDVIGTLSTTDADETDTHLYTLVTNPGDAFNILNDQLRASESFDFETTASYDIRIETDDQNGGVFEKDFTITIGDVNENNAPTDIVLSSIIIDENNEIGDLVATLSTADVDEGDTHTYSLVSNPGFKFRIVDDRLEANAFFNFESTESYDITIRTTDGDEDFEKEVTISINDINDVPTNVGLTSTSITENNEVGDLIGIIGTADEDEADDHSYTLLVNPGNAFSIDNNRLEANVIFDFDSQNSYDIEIRSSDGNGGQLDREFTITIDAIIDEEGPMIVSVSPVDNSVDVAIGADLVVTFNEDIQALNGLVKVVRVGSGQEVVSGALNSGLDVFTIDGDQLTIHTGGEDRKRDLFPGGEYYVSIPNSALRDLAGNNLTNGFTDQETWTFTVAKADPNLTLEAIPDKETTDGPFIVSATSDNSIRAIVFSVIAGPATIDGDEITLTGAIGTVTVQAAQAASGTYVSATASQSFEVAAPPDETAPTIDTFSPGDGATGVAPDGDLQVIFDEPIQPGAGQVWVRRLSNQGIVLNASFGNTPDNLSIDGNTLTIHLEDPNLGTFEHYTDYFVVIFDDAVQDLSGNSFAEGYNDNTTWNFKTVEATITWSGAAWSNGSGPSSIDHAIIDGDYAGFFECVDLTVNDGVTLTISGALDVHGDLINDGNVIVQSGASVLTYAGSSVTGNPMAIHRNTRYADGRYSFVGSPVGQVASVTHATLGSRVYYYDESQPYGENEGLARWQSMSGELVPGVGYTQAFQQEIVFNGMPNNGVITVDGSYTGTHDDGVNEDTEGWNLVSNPYAAAINVSTFLTENPNIEGAVYIWDDNGSDNGRGSNADYIVANGTVATNTTEAGGQTRYNQALGTAQAFFVKLENDSDTEISFTEEMRLKIKNLDESFFRSASVPAYSRINLTNTEGLFKQTIVGWISGISDELVDRAFDARVFSASAPDMIYTMKGGTQLAIQGMSYSREVISLGLNIATEGYYTIAVDDSLAQGQGLFLRDRLTDEVINLHKESYSFSSEAGVFTDRFELLTSHKVLGVESSTLQVYAYDQTLIVNLPDDEVSDVKLVTLAGKQVFNQLVKGSARIELTLPAGVYIATDGERSHKIILK